MSDPSEADMASVVALLDDECARGVLEATAREPRTAAELASRTDVSRQTVYRRLDRLQEAGLVSERIHPRPDGHHETAYRATLEEVRISLTNDGFTFAVDAADGGQDAADELTRLWRNFRE